MGLARFDDIRALFIFTTVKYPSSSYSILFLQIHDAVEAAMAAGGEKSIASSSSSKSDLKRKGELKS